MSMPGFTADAGVGACTTHYSGRAGHGAAGGGGLLHPALVAPSVCKTTPCMKVGACSTRVSCCRLFNGRCSCTVQPCYGSAA